MDDNQEMLQVQRGEIYLADLDDMNLGTVHVQQGSRPVLIIQNEVGNKFAPTVIVALITASQKKEYPMHQYVTLNRPSTILYEQIATIDKTRLIRKIGKLTDEQVYEANRKLGLSLELDLMMISDLVKLEVLRKEVTVTREGERASYVVTLYSDSREITVNISDSEISEGGLEIDKDNELDSLEKALDSIKGLRIISKKITERGDRW